MNSQNARRRKHFAPKIAYFRDIYHGANGGIYCPALGECHENEHHQREKVNMH